MFQAQRQAGRSTFVKGEIPYEGGVVDLFSGRCSAREEHQICFEGSECVAEGF